MQGTNVDFSSDEMMIVAASRWLTKIAEHGKSVCFVGIGLPSAAANLARQLHPPGPVLVYESGCVGSKPTHLPLSIGDGELADTAVAVVSVPEIFSYWLQGGRISIGFLGAAQIDRHGNLNSTVIGDYGQPTVRLPGAGGAPEIAASADSVGVIIRQSPRTFVEKCDFRTSLGLGDGEGHRQRLGLRGGGPARVITDLGELEPRNGQLVMTALYPGVTTKVARERTGWSLCFDPDIRSSPPPSREEIAALRKLRRG